MLGYTNASGGLVKRGLKAELSTLSPGEFMLTTDEKKLYMGTDSGNIVIVNQADFDTQLSKKMSNLVASVNSDNEMRRIDAGPVAVTPDVTDAPYKGWWRGIIVGHGNIGNDSQLSILSSAHSPDDLWFRNITNGTVLPWVRFATATPPQEFDLPLAEGWAEAYTSWFSKNQFGCVHVAGQFTKMSAVSVDEVIATFPAGYWPKYNTLVLCRVMDSTGKKEFLQAVAYTNGEFKMTEASTIAAHRVSFDPFDFPAQSGPIAYGAPIRMVATRMSRMATMEEPIDKCFCVVNANGEYQTLVLVTITNDELGTLYTPHCYDLKDGERLIDTTFPTMRQWAGAPGFILPRWNHNGMLWEEASSQEQIAAWEIVHQDPVTFF